MYGFADLDETETVLQKMMDRPEGALVQKLPHAPGTKEPRYVHTLGGTIEQAAPVHATTAHAADRISTLESEVARLRDEVADLRRRLDEVL
jgi:uncharacterized protein YceH (UPF0502 family)